MKEQPTALDILKDIQDIEQTAIKEKIELTPKVREYLHDGMELILDKSKAGEKITEADMKFLQNVKTWMSMSEKLRGQFPDIKKMVESEEKSVEERESITLQQLEDLLNIAKILERQTFQIHDIPVDERCTFKNGKIIVTGFLTLRQTLITSIPEGLCVEKDLVLNEHITNIPEGVYVGRDLNLDNAQITSWPKRLYVGRHLDLGQKSPITNLPNGLYVEGDLTLLENPHEQLKKDAEKLKAEGKIKGNIKYIYNY